MASPIGISILQKISSKFYLEIKFTALLDRAKN
jgi:hypothetical protein